MKVLFFIGSLCVGGKERRLVELLSYFKQNTNYSLVLVARRDQIDYPVFYKLKIPYILLTNKYKKRDIRLQYNFYKICKEQKPDVIHTWGKMPTFVSLLAVILIKIPLINSQITDAFSLEKWSINNIINKINFHFSSIILANSYAGLQAYKVKMSKSKVIYNGVNLDRFTVLADKESCKIKYNITTKYVIIMVASFSKYKDYDLFIQIAKYINSKRNDVSFIAVGEGINLNRIKKRVYDEQIAGIRFTGKINDIESLVNLADIGVLFSPKGEGISNTIIEYMALGKPVIATSIGGTNEIVRHNINGLLIKNESTEEIASLIIDLLDNDEKRERLGKAGRSMILESFSIDRMGKAFINVYNDYMVPR